MSELVPHIEDSDIALVTIEVAKYLTEIERHLKKKYANPKRNEIRRVFMGELSGNLFNYQEQPEKIEFQEEEFQDIYRVITQENINRIADLVNKSAETFSRKDGMREYELQYKHSLLSAVWTELDKEYVNPLPIIRHKE